MRGFLTALQFLTLIRLDRSQADAKALAASTIYFPLVGALLGLMLICLNEALSLVFPSGITSVMLVAGLAILTGGLHLDGLADTFDALAAGKDREKKLNIMRDSHKGTFGVLALVVVILLKAGLVSSLPTGFKNLGLFLMTMVSRYSFDLSFFTSSYAREAGKAKVFFEGANARAFFISSLVTLVLIVLTRRPMVGLAVLFLSAIFTLAINKRIKKAIGGLTGDTLGALCELNEVCSLLLIFVISQLK